MEEDPILISLKVKAATGDIEAVKALMEYERSRQYVNLISGMDDDELTGEAPIANQLQLN